MATKDYMYSDFNGDLFRQNDGDVELNTDIDSIRNSLKNIMTTMMGSRRMLPEFGSNFYKLLFEPMDDITARRIGSEFLSSIQTWEKRIKIENLNVQSNYDNNQYEVTVNFSIVGSISSSNIYSVTTILKRG